MTMRHLLTAALPLCHVRPVPLRACRRALAVVPSQQTNEAASGRAKEAVCSTEVDELVSGWYAAWNRVDEADEGAVQKSKSAPPEERVRKVDQQGRAHGLGRRKTAVANVWIKENAESGRSGVFYVNGIPFADYFACSDSWKDHAIEPFFATGTLGQFDVACTTKGGGLGGQSGAIRLGLSRALQNFDPTLRPALKSVGMLTRDARMVERKKPGQRKARRKFQWVKR